jgi:hypothetical protein
MIDGHKMTIRYLGYRTLPDGGREFDFSFEMSGVAATTVTIDAPITFFRGAGQIAIQEAAGICYETLKSRLQTDQATPPSLFNLTEADVAQHRQSRRSRSGRR